MIALGDHPARRRAPRDAEHPRRLAYAAGTALLALVAAEQINSQAGIGYILNTANQFQRTDIILAGILVYAVLGLVVDGVMRGWSGPCSRGGPPMTELT